MKVHRYIGMDVHKETIVVATADEGNAPPALWGTIPNEEQAIRTCLATLAVQKESCHIVYEAGPTGLALHRYLTKLGYDCKVSAPSLIPRIPGSRVKTDNRDALLLARMLRAGDLVTIHVPTEDTESLRNLVRLRRQAVVDRRRVENQMGMFLLRNGIAAPKGMRHGTQRYEQWCAKITFPRPADELVFGEYRASATLLKERVLRIEAMLEETASQHPLHHLIDALTGLRGIGLLTAITIATEVGDFQRFPHPTQFMSYVGLTPSEYSSGASRHRGAITKSGNPALRHVIVEAAHHSRYQPSVTAKFRRRVGTLPQSMQDISWRAQLRLHSRYTRLSCRIGRPKTITAVARELCAYIWEMGIAAANQDIGGVAV